MKNYFVLVITLILIINLYSCSSDDDSIQDEIPEFAMTAKINGTFFQANTPFGDNNFSGTNIWNYFPLEDFVLLQGRQGGVLGNPEINLWLKRSDIIVDNYQIGEETYDTPPSHFIDLIDNSNNEYEETKQGIVSITEVNSSMKTVKGTFEFTTVDNVGDPSSPINFTITEGTFNYKYE